jgi:tetratricopeptide (TPR) repeat protein
MPTSSNKPIKRTIWLVAILPALAAFFIYLPALQNDFVNWDDDDYVYQNPFIQKIDLQLFKWAFFSFHAANWHPLTWISHALDIAVWGLNPWGHHLTNVILHSINTLLVVLFVVRLLTVVREKTRSEISPAFLDEKGMRVAAFATGLLFGLHPLHVESVAWISERKDLLCGFFYLFGIYLYLRKEWGAEPSSRVRAPIFDKNYFLVLGCFIGALLCKPMAVTFPAVLLLLDFYPLNRFSSPGSLKKIVLEKTPLLLVSLCSSIVTIFAQHSGSAIASLQFAPFSSRVLIAAHAFYLYLQKMIVPVHLVPLYPYPQDVRLFTAPFLLSIFFILAIALSCRIGWKWRKSWCALWAYYAITILPVIGLIQVGFQAMADRYAYLPSLGPFVSMGLFAAWTSHTMSNIASPSRKKTVGLLVTSAAAAVLLLLSHLTLTQIAIWKDSLTLWNYEISVEPDGNPVAYYHRGIAYQTNERYAEAIRDYSKAISINPGYYEAYNNRATVYDALDQPEPAIRDYTQSLALKPHFRIFYNRGMSYARVGAYANAIEDFTRSLSLYPDNAGAYVNRGFAYLNISDRQRARLDFEKGCVLGNETGCNRLNELTRNTEKPGIK